MNNNNAAVNSRIRGLHRHVPGKKSVIPAVALLLISTFILTVFPGDGYSKDQKKSEPGNMKSEFITDYDGNQSATVKIGNQIWMAENLKTLHYSDGTQIKEVYAYDDDEQNSGAYGRLYPWETITNQNRICPQGWHVPTDAEWKDLERHLGMIAFHMLLSSSPAGQTFILMLTSFYLADI